jgi:hypothetical protein
MSFPAQVKIHQRKFRIPKLHRDRLFKSWFEVEELPTLGEGINVLLVIGLKHSEMTPNFRTGN